jgi:hypothetical protein
VAESDASFNFVQAYSLPFDYHLRDAQSAAVNAGTVGSTPVADDIDGDPRSDGLPDLGADEFVP